MAKNEERVQLPADLTTLSDEQLAALHTQAENEFDTQVADTEGNGETRLARVAELADIIETLRGETDRRAQATAELEEALAAQIARVRPEPEEEAETEAESEAPAAAVTASVRERNGNGAVERVLSGDVMPQAARKLNPSLADLRRRAGKVPAPRRNSSVLVASAEIPNIQQGSSLPDINALVDAITRRARSLPLQRRGLETTVYPVASMQLEHRFTLGLDATPAQFNEVMTAAANPDALVAAGGWCSPSEISYDFYNIVAEDGMFDLPTFGVSRGGFRWPTSPSYASITSNYWTWTETQDVAALTGTDQSGTKVCYRVPCSEFNEERLRCDGFCMTVGNLMKDAFPEQIANHTRLTFAGHAHRMNSLRLNAAATLANPYSYGAAGAGLVAPLLGALELSATDLRERYRMQENAVLEVVLPRWLRGAMRSDLRKRTGVDLLEVADARLMNMFDLLNIRVQWVTDWQVGGAGQPGGATNITVWPTQVQFMMYPAGTYMLGRGMELNLGIVRDSVLNATNDHTAEWMEECWLLAMVGHESILGTVEICPDGTTGAADLTACGV